MFKDLEGKVVLVTGSSRGIGLATAQLLSRLGAKPILNASSPSQEVQQAAEALGTEFHVADVASDEQVEAMVAAITARNGSIYGLVNNAGGGGFGSIFSPDSEWQKSWDRDLMGAVHTCRHILPAMAESGEGVVVNVTSLWGIEQTAKPAIASYCCAKAALSKLTEVLAQQYAPQIRVNGVAPGWTRTQMIESMFKNEDFDFMEANVLLERLAKPEQIASTIVFLLSQMSANITGQDISADGGYLLNRDHFKP